MNDITFVLMTMILNLILVLTIIDFYDIFFAKCQKQKAWYHNLIYIAYYTFSVTAVLIDTNGDFNIICGFIFIFLLTLKYKVAMLNRLVAVAFFMSMLIIAEVIPLFFLSELHDYRFKDFDKSVTWMMYAFLISRVVPFVLIKIYKFYNINKNSFPNSSAKIGALEGAYFIAMPICGMGIIYYLLNLVYAEQIENQLYVGLCMVIILVFIVIFYLTYVNNLDLIELRAKELILDEQIEQYAEHYEELKDNLNEFYTYKHDVKHKLIELLSELNINEKEILEKFNMTFDGNLDFIYYSGNKSIDMLLNYNVNKAKTHNIEPIVKIPSELLINIDERSLCVILGNLLDNAIEACTKFQKPLFDFEMKNQNSNLFISIENEYDGKLEILDTLPQSTKGNKLKHGKGLSTVKKLVENNDGYLHIDESDNKFRVQILLLNTK